MYSPKRRFRLVWHPGWSGANDNIANALTTSLSAYNSASIGDWVKITSTEYNSLKTSVLNTSLIGLSDAQFALAVNGNFAGASNTFMAVNTADATHSPAIPADAYLYAISFRYNTTTSSTIEAYTNTNSASYTGWVKLGPTLPTTTVGVNYYVRKRPATTNGATAGLLSMYSGSGGGLYFAYKNYAITPNPVTGRYRLNPEPISSSTNLNTSINGLSFAIQGLATTTSNQW